jgi:hypothetical protein
MTMNCECAVDGATVVVRPASANVRSALSAAGVDIEGELRDVLLQPEEKENLDAVFARLGGINAGNNTE